MKKVVLVVLCIIASCCFFGCTNNSIEFKRDSVFSEMMKGIDNSPEPKVRKSSGVVIYKDNAQQNKSNANTGNSSNDMNFDLKVKF